jgi:hypothetical protein
MALTPWGGEMAMKRNMANALTTDGTLNEALQWLWLFSWSNDSILLHE